MVSFFGGDLEGQEEKEKCFMCFRGVPGEGEEIGVVLRNILEVTEDCRLVKVCGDCGEVTGKMASLYKQLEECMEEMRRIMTKAEEETQQNMGDYNPGIFSLRRMTKEKCVAKLAKRQFTCPVFLKSAIKIEETPSPVINIKQELLISPQASPLIIPDLQTNLDSVEEDLLPQLEPLDNPLQILTKNELILPPPPPPVNIPPKTSKKSHKKSTSIKRSASQNILTTVSQCPVDFYFHKKQDNRHVCPFCTDTSPTLTNLRFHVIRAHPHELFSTSRLSHVPLKPDFKAQCELMLFCVTKESETGDRNANGTKVIVRCPFCCVGGDPLLEEEPKKMFCDKRAFQCHLILNHYPKLTEKLLEIQLGQRKVGEVAKEEIEGMGGGDSAGKKKRSWVYKLGAGGGSAKKKCGKKVGGDEEVTGEVNTTPGGRQVGTGGFICEHCGKNLSSSTSKWRHKQQYCEVLRSRGEIGEGTNKLGKKKSPQLQQQRQEEEEEEEVAQEEIIQDSGWKGEGLEVMEGVKLEEGWMLEETRMGEGMMMEEYGELCSDFKDFYDEQEVNDALLTMMMENVNGTGGDPTGELGVLEQGVNIEEDPLGL